MESLLRPAATLRRLQADALRTLRNTHDGKRHLCARRAIPLTIALLVLPQASILEVASALDPLRNANRQLGEEAFRWRIVTPDGGPVALTCGLSLPSDGPLAAAEGAEVLIVIAGYRLQEVATWPLIRDLRRMAPRFRLVGGVDAGPWVMARAGFWTATAPRCIGKTWRTWPRATPRSRWCPTAS
jgi:transcriptional regulator GlxA family with amidase domain